MARDQSAKPPVAAIPRLGRGWAASGRTAILSTIDEDTAIITERRYHQGRELSVTWHPDLALTAADRVTQVYALCFTPAGQLLLVSQDGDFWTLPGGSPEPGETHAATLAREVWEEACARVTAHWYLGAQRVSDASEDAPYYQLRYLARVTVEPFRPQHEMRHRKLVDLETARRLLWGGRSAIGKHLLDRVNEIIG